MRLLNRRPPTKSEVHADPIEVTTYRINWPRRSITCLVCGLTSYNPNDVEARYCGHCHASHDLPQTFGAALLYRLAQARP